jgi:hypothetical protein
MFAPVTSATDTTDLSLLQAHTFERVFGLSSGTTITCPVSPGLPNGTVASASDSPGTQGVYYTLAQQPGGTYNLWSDVANPLTGTWSGPSVLPGQPDHANNQLTPLAAWSNGPGTTNVFFLQKGKLVNDYSLGGSGKWQGPGGLPGTPDNANLGGGIAATSAGSSSYVFFWQKGSIVYDVDSGAGWTGPFTAIANVVSSGNSETPLAATAINGAVTLIYETFNYSTGNAVAATLVDGSWTTTTAAANIDQQTPLAITTPVGGVPTLIYTTGNNGGSNTNLVASSLNGAAWSVSGTVAGSIGFPVASVTASSSLAGELDVYLVPPSGDQHNIVGHYLWTPSGGWLPQAPLPVPTLTGQYSH